MSEPKTGLDPAIAARLKRNADGLIAAVAQERGSGDVLMVAWMDDDALARTLATREATYFSRSRAQQWVKGATSGHTQYVHSVRLDCDGDTVLLEVDQRGGACHTGDHSCFDADVLLAPED
jgi:phosphoribosyl-AMP cyclohydrolase